MTISKFRTLKAHTRSRSFSISSKGGWGVVFAGRWEMKIFSMVFQDFGKYKVGKWYFQH